MRLSEILKTNLSTEIEREMIQGGEDPKHHQKATALPGGPAARAGEYSKGFPLLSRMQLKMYINFNSGATRYSLVTLQYAILSFFVLFCYIGGTGEVEAAAALLKGETPGLRLLEGWLSLHTERDCLTPMLFKAEIWHSLIGPRAPEKESLGPLSVENEKATMCDFFLFVQTK